MYAGFKGGFIKYKWGQRCTEKDLNNRSNQAEKTRPVFLRETKVIAQIKQSGAFGARAAGPTLRD